MMRPDQIERLRALQEKLCEVVLEEADPETWPGAGQQASDLTREDRGDRYWCKKNAAATFAILERTTSTLTNYRPPTSLDAAGQDDDMERQIAKREKEASKMLDDLMAKSKRTADAKK